MEPGGQLLIASDSPQALHEVWALFWGGFVLGRRLFWRRPEPVRLHTYGPKLFPLIPLIEPNLTESPT